MQNAENRYDQEEPFEALTPEKIFDARWAMAMLGEARWCIRAKMHQLGQARFLVLSEG